MNPDSEVLDAAFNNINNQNVIADFARKGTDWRIRRAAIKKVVDEGELVALLRNEESSIVKVAALNNITTQSLLADIAKFDKDYSVRRTAFKKINDQVIIKDITSNGRYPDILLFAVNQLDASVNYHHLINMVNNKKNTEQNVAAIGALKTIPMDKNLLEYYGKLEIIVNIDDRRQHYIPGGDWIRFVYTINIKF